MAHRRGGFAKKIDTVHWTGFTFDDVALASSSIDAKTLIGAQHLPETLLRIRGEWAATLDGAQGAIGAAKAVCGIIQVPEGTGTTVLWSPFIDDDAPWIWWDVMHLMHEEYVVDVLGTPAASAGRRVMDSKAMRKLRNTELQFVVSNVPITGLTASPLNISACGRMLAGS